VLEELVADVTLGPDKRRALCHAASRAGELVAGRELHDVDRVHAVLVQAASTRRFSRADAERTIRRGIQRGMQSPHRAPTNGQRISDADDARRRLLLWKQAVDERPWHGARGANTLKLLGAFFSLAHRAGSMQIGASYRTLAESAHVSHATVSRHRGELAGWVRLLTPGDRRTGVETEWRIIERQPDESSWNNPAYAGEKATGLFQNDPSIVDPNYWYGRPNKHRLWSVLIAAQEPMTITTLAATVGIGRKAVADNLRLLANDGLAARGVDGWTWCWPTTEYDGPDFAGLRRARHAADRERHARWREHEDNASRSMKAEAQP
jgi:hypothetical protein